jgi:hypothetical protein
VLQLNPNALARFIASGAVIGAGDNGTPIAAVLRGPAAAGSNVAGANLTLDGSTGTGNAAGGDLIFRTAPAGSSGSTPGTLTERLRITSLGAVSGQFQDKGGAAYNAMAYSVTGNGTTDDGPALNTLISTVVTAGGGTIVLPGGRTYALSTTISLKSNVFIEVGAGATLKWTGSAGGTMFESDVSVPLLRAGVVGSRAFIDPNALADRIFYLHSPQFCEFAGFEVKTGRTTTIVFDIAADSTATTGGYQATKNAVLCRFHDFIVPGTIGKGVRLTGTVGNVVTLNHFENLWFFDVRSVGIEFVAWADNNTFSGNIDIQLAASSAAGVVMNSSSPTTDVGVYANHFSDLAVDAFSSGFTGRTGIKLNNSKRTYIACFHADPQGEGGAIVDNGFAVSYYILRTGRGNSALNDLHVKGMTQSPPGCEGDGIQVVDGAMTTGSTTLTSATANFQSYDVGKPITVTLAGASGATLVTTISAWTNATTVTLAAANASGGNVTNATVSYGTDNATALVNAMATAQTYGGDVLLSAGVYCIASTVTLRQDTQLRLEAGTTVRWLGAAGGTMFSTTAAEVTLRGGLVGNKSTLDANGLADFVFDLHSVQFCEFGNVQVLNCRTTTRVIRLKPDATTLTDGTQYRRNCAYNTFHPVWVPGSCDTVLEMAGMDNQSVITLNHFRGLFGQSVLGVGIRMVAWCDNNVFLDANDFQVDANNATGVTFNESVVGSIYFVNITNGGSGYTNYPGTPPTVTFSGGGATRQAAGYAFVVSGAVLRIHLTDNGAGYAQSGYLGTGGTLNLTTSAGAITSAVVNAAGSGYPASTAIRLAVTSGGGTGGEVTITTNAAGQLAGAVTISVAGTGYANTTGATTSNTPLVTISGGGGTGAVATAYNGGPTVDVGVYANKFSHLAIDGFNTFTGRRGLVFANSKHNVVQSYHQDPAVEGGAIVNLGSALSYIVERTGIPGGARPEFTYYNTRFCIGSKAANDGVSTLTIGGTGTTDATYGWTHYDSAGRFLSGMTDGGFFIVQRYSDSTGGTIAVVQVFNTSAQNGAFLGHYAFKAYNNNVQLHTQALVGARFVNVSSVAMSSRLELGFMDAWAESGANNQPNKYAYVAAEGIYGPMNIASGVTATPSISAAGVVPAFGLSTTGGSAKVIALATPAAPATAVPAVTGATSYWWWLVAEDRNGMRTMLSPFKTIANGAATVSGTNFITVGFVNVAGAVKFYLLRTATATVPTGTSNILAKTVTVTTGTADAAALSVVDDTPVGSLTSFTVPTRNTTADLAADGTLTIGNGAALASPVGCTLNVNNTPVTVNGTVATDQNLMSFSVPAGALNALNKELEIFGAGTLNTVAATAVTAIVIKVKLGGITLATFTTTAPAASQVNTPWNFILYAGVTTAGTSGAVESHGDLRIRLAAGAGASTLFSDVITAPVSSVDLTAAQTLQVTVALTGNAVSTNNVTQRKMVSRLLN